jgi:hypothetical protein
MVIPRTKEEVDSLEFKDINMRVGIHERLWVKNVAAIGLSAGFIEPLESNGLFSVHVFLSKLVRVLSLPKVNQTDKDFYNAAVRGIFENFTEFVSLHYGLSHREDTQYWKDIFNRTFNKKMVALEPDRTVGYFDFQDTFMFKFEYENINAGIHCIATGLEYLMLDDFIYKNKEFAFQANYDNILQPIEKNFSSKKNKWLEAAESELSLYEYLKKNIYKD